ncbi:hypothetical protein B7R21_06255 [Subtercola boreus]|uniref:AB hydrolase-1 domain-containing protein n=1 Tax=Subtercola boreus TaxID=120213 RepID=A0A3E0VWU1_9MICO|nr:hypothetical protein [Subtercola boreus]RFA14544.1 hypothetical protein B7R21_06255 [Subtercola boreus]
MAFTSVGTYTTSSGLVCTIYETDNGADRLQLIIPNGTPPTGGRHGVMWLHGSQGEYNQMLTISSLATLRDTILNNGGFIAQSRGSKTSSFNGLNGWGRDTAKVAYSELAQQAAAFITVVDWVVIGRSMGGEVGKWLVTQDTYLASRTLGYVDMSGIYDMLAEYDDGNHFDHPSWYGTTEPPTPPARPDPAPDYADPAWAAWRSSLTSWRSNSATVSARSALATATTTNDPGRITASLWAGKKVLVVYGTKDTTAYPPIAGLKFWNDYNTQFDAATKQLVAVTGATHAQTAGTYDAPQVPDFIKQLWGIITPSFKVGNKIDAMYFLDRDNQLHRMNPVPV